MKDNIISKYRFEIIKIYGRAMLTFKFTSFNIIKALRYY